MTSRVSKTPQNPCSCPGHQRPCQLQSPQSPQSRLVLLSQLDSTQIFPRPPHCPPSPKQLAPAPILALSLPLPHTPRSGPLVRGPPYTSTSTASPWSPITSVPQHKQGSSHCVCMRRGHAHVLFSKGKVRCGGTGVRLTHGARAIAQQGRQLPSCH